MKRITLMIFCLFLLNACKSKNEEQKEIIPKVVNPNYSSFGKEITGDDAQLAVTMVSTYKKMQVGDSVQTKIIAKVNDVCQAKGCWMRLQVDNEHEMMVKFKDYSFFVPKDITGKKVIVNGKAFVKEVSVEEQQHYAEDAGKSKADIAKITEPKRTYSFEADGVLVVQ
jgi:hypothetical protein